ncbi:xylulose kinase-1 [Tanacetum coccineum]|uniref:Xylulose kinase-1 n=1 Tax=Tanacetum coccineum TaxID=301880 RepID=A0ABQ4WKR5_9ASTR
MTKTTNDQGFISAIYEGKTHEDLHTCLFAYFLSQEEPKRTAKSLSDSAWVEAMQEELLQFKLQQVWVLGYTQEEGIDYDEVFSPVARIEAIRLFLAYASFMGFMVYQMDVKSAFLYGKIEEEVYVDDIIFGSTKKELCIEFEKLMHDKFQMSSMGELTFFLDTKSTTGGCQFLGCRLISWQCKKQTVVATSSTEAEYVAATSCCGQVLWIQNQMLDYGTLISPSQSMANLEFCDKHNMVAYLQKSEGSKGFHQIVDFLTASHIRYALTESPTIYVSLIEQFWQTATACTLENGDMEITAAIDGKVKVVFEASIRRHLKQETEVPQSSSPTQTHVADEAASIGVDVRNGGATTTVSSLDAGQGSGNIDKTPAMPHDSPLLRVHTFGSDEGRMQHNKLMDLVTKLSDRVVSLETDLHQTKKVYGAAYTKFIKKVKRLEDKLNKSRRKRRLGRKIAHIDDDKGITLVQMGAQTRGRHDHEMEAGFEFTTVKDVSTINVPVSTTSAEISTASPKVKTAGVSVDDVAAKGLVYIRRSATKRKDKGKAIMEEFEPTQTKTKIQQEQERLGCEEAQRLQE